MRLGGLRVALGALVNVLADIARFGFLTLHSHTQLAAENLFLRKQLAMYVERQVKPQRADDTTRITLAALSRLVNWRELLVVVKPDTLIRWHRKSFRLFCRWKSKRPGRSRVPTNLQQLIAEMAAANRTWGEERIAAELLVKVGVHLSPRTVRRYMPRRTPPRRRTGSQTWRTFVRNHAKSVLACDFFVSVTATFRVVYVFVVLDVGARRIVHWNTTEHPTADWTAQQFRMAISGDQPYRYVIHDRDSIYSEGVDRTLEGMGLTVRLTPFRAPQANAFCERLVGSIRRECLDFVIPVNERHLREILTCWIPHYNRGRPHASLGPGIPDPPADLNVGQTNGHLTPADRRVVATPILGGLHHEYRLVPAA
jgi:transposase InsO family protein